MKRVGVDVLDWLASCYFGVKSPCSELDPFLSALVSDVTCLTFLEIDVERSAWVCCMPSNVAIATSY